MKMRLEELPSEEFCLDKEKCESFKYMEDQKRLLRNYNVNRESILKNIKREKEQRCGKCRALNHDIYVQSKPLPP